jgi:glucose 1-dehydrogenase
MRLLDRVAIITGSGRGIGRAVALAFAREGASVVVNGRIGSGTAEQVASEIDAAGGHAVAVSADVGNLESHRALVSAALDNFGRLDILVNNAGIEFREPFLDATEENWDRTLAVNLKGAYFLSQRAARAMGGKRGKIVNISSIHDSVPLRNLSIYSISKGGLTVMTRSLALELAERNINVNAISPGAIRTDINREVLSDPAYEAKVVEKIPLGRIGCVEDLTGLAIFLASPEADYITGTTIYVDGGILL